MTGDNKHFVQVQSWLQLKNGITWQEAVLLNL